MIVKSPHADVAIPDISLHELILQTASRLGDKPALIDGPSGRTITYQDLAGAINAVAAGLHARGFGRGDVFALFLPNLPEYAVIYHAVARLGGACTTANPLYKADELAFQLNDAGAKFLLTVPPFAELCQEAARQSPVKEVFVLGEAEGLTPFTELALPGGEVPDVKVDKDTVVALPYSSGTTGLPKGVELTHGNLVANLHQTDPVIPIDENSVLLAVLPFFHCYGQQVIMNTGLAYGSTIVSLPRFDLEEFLKTAQDHKVTRLYLVPPIMLALAKHPTVDNYDLSSVEMILSGAAPLGSDLQSAVEKRLDCRVTQGYGLTETGPVTNAVPLDGDPKSGSAGPLIANTEARIVDVDSGKELETGERGEICVRGPQIMKGYLNNTEATAATIDTDGFLHTGDIGYVDEDGYFYIVDRLKELIKYKGFQVPPAELEALLITHPKVADVAVIGSPDEEAGELPKAFIVKEGELTEAEIKDFVAAKVAPHKKIRMVEFVDEIPKSASGKILRRVLIEQERARA